MRQINTQDATIMKQRNFDNDSDGVWFGITCSCGVISLLVYTPYKGNKQKAKKQNWKVIPSFFHKVSCSFSEEGLILHLHTLQ